MPGVRHVKGDIRIFVISVAIMHAGALIVGGFVFLEPASKDWNSGLVGRPIGNLTHTQYNA